jgi:hypothetical protein
MNNRKAARQALHTLLQTIATFAAGYDHPTLDFERKSPVYMLLSDGTRHGAATTLADYEREHQITIAIYWHQSETSENEMDDLVSEVFDKLEANAGPNATWDGLRFDDDFSRPDFPPPLDGVAYRSEYVRVIVW